MNNYKTFSGWLILIKLKICDRLIKTADLNFLFPEPATERTFYPAIIKPDPTDIYSYIMYQQGDSAIFLPVSVFILFSHFSILNKEAGVIIACAVGDL